MAVIHSTWTEHWRGATGAVTRDPLASEYTAVYRVQTDDPDDQAQTVLLYVQTQRILLGSPYTYAGDTALGVSVANRITADRELGSTDWWVVVVSYATPGADGDDDGLDNNGDPVLDPLDFRPRVSMATVTYQKPCEKAEYIGGLAVNVRRPVGWEGPPMNSAFVPYNPLPPMDDHRQVFTIARNVPNVDCDFMETNIINLLPFNLVYIPSPGHAIVKEFPKYTGKLRDWRCQLRRTNGVDHWEVSCVLDHNKDTWVTELLDRGIHADAADGKPDGKGGEFGSSDAFGNPRPAVPVGVPCVRRLIDDDSNSIDEPVLLDGNGKPIPCDQEPIVPVYGRWLCYDAQNIKTIGWLGFNRFFTGIIQGV